MSINTSDLSDYVDLSCEIDICNSLIYKSSRYCSLHFRRNTVHGTPCPIIECYGCHNEFVWETPSFRQKPYCNDCLLLLHKYVDYIPKTDSSISKITSNGMNLVEYLKLLESQGFRCICGDKPRKGERLCLDHDHSCCPGPIGCKNCFRGLLCHSCNIVVGYLALIHR